MAPAVDFQSYNDRIAGFRHDEYPMLKTATYLDHAGTTLHSRSLVNAFAADMLSSMIANPHSMSSSSQTTAQSIDDIRVQVLHFFEADPYDFDLIFVANATAAIKLVAEAFRDHSQGFWYGYHKDSHTSIVGVRELCSHGSRCFISDAEIEEWLETPGYDLDCVTPRLFAYTGQSNMNGKRFPMQWASRTRQGRHPNTYTLFDAAALVATSSLDLSDSELAPDFTVLSFYKIFGFPDLGALIVHKRAAPVFKHRKYFGGGTVEAVSCLDEPWYARKFTSLHASLEDGSLPLRNILALQCALSTHVSLYGTQMQISAHTTYLAKVLHDKLRNLRHSNGQKVCTIYKDELSEYGDPATQGPILAFNLRNQAGVYHSCHELNKLAAVKDIHFRTGTLCNPGGVASTLNLTIQDLKDSYDAGVRCGSAGDIQHGKPLAMARISLGASSTLQDIDRFIQFIEEFYVDREPQHLESKHRQVLGNYHIKSITIFPIKSCGGWSIPEGLSWPVRSTGLAWDRHWCLVHQGTKAYINQKRCPKMALLKPTLDFKANKLYINFTGEPSDVVPATIAIALSENTSTGGPNEYLPNQPQDVRARPQVYNESLITNFFSVHLGVPCYLARIPEPNQLLDSESKKQGSTLVQSGLLVPTFALPTIGKFPTPPPSPPPFSSTLANESPILVISQSSLDHVNRFGSKQSESQVDGLKGFATIDSDAFRANITLAFRKMAAAADSEDMPPAFEEESWSKIRIFPLTHGNRFSGSDVVDSSVINLDVTGACQRCQMICINQTSGKRQPGAFTTLARLRKGEGRVCFGIHCTPLSVTAASGWGGPCIQVGNHVEGITS